MVINAPKLDDLDRQIAAACEAVGAVETSKEIEFPMELQESFYLCATGGLSLADLIWEVKREVVRAAVHHHKQKKLAANGMEITSQTLWNIENGHHK
jgi:hypothetical protein